MRSIKYLTENDESVRTQITLTKKLKELVEKYARQRGESLSEYLRKAAMVRLMVEEKGEQDLQKVADRVIGSVDLEKHPEWSTKEDLQKWLRKIRKEW